MRDFDRLRRQVRRRSARRRPRGWIVRATAIGLGLLLLLTLFPPLRYPVPGTVSSRFSLRRKPDSSSFLTFEVHDGLDIAAARGTRVVAAAPGVVTAVGEDAVSGKYVRIRHPLGT